ncbi:translation initiation factor IF-2 [Pseudanabaena sp. FACHB-2040]|uniref:translation initiation factor IF-2 n=1 Tax=Pseudanabaena sp. FACHB-2040 TaxID=2692859 RepID=UPI001682CE05|nr:translation initiation factor IF-2 [Pseudanabaena sp. FACHB-2040]MBD2260821.1 translation initiation factor IF-2 [Pseudanabaena sp. FACHB-2040]
MNSGKVRIYELSRELNLENKDLLAICDRLNVAVKSHSSTITEDEADQIRSAAKQARSSSGGNGASKPRPTLNPKNGGGQPVVHKQQILEIRRHRPPIKPNRPAEPPAAQEADQPMQLEEQPMTAAASADTLMKPPARDGLVSPAAAEPVQEIQDAAPPLQRTPAPTVPSEPQAPVSPAPPASRAISKPRTELVSPPSRPTRPVREPGVAAPSRPVIRQNTDGSSDEREQRSIEVREVRRPVPIREVDEPASGGGGPVLKPKPRLRRARGDEDDTTQTDSNQPKKELEGMPSGGEGDLGDSLLRRPSPPRHRRKEREEEDEEQEMRKAGKVTKAKRRGPVLDDEDEDLEEIIEGEDGEQAGTDPSFLSLSIARPPKPKKQGVSKPTAPTMRSHKPSGRENARARRERREQANKQERPGLLILTEGLTVHELAEKIAVPETEIIKSLFFKGIAANINQTLDLATTKQVAEEFEVVVETVEAESEAKKVTEMLDVADMESLQRRPPVITIMGHVDHGKTSLLDSIRKTKVAQGEAGGITQHIGAYHVDLDHNDQKQQIVFLDTPGHEAFTAMRARGARVTDIAILVVAADDGVRPQTIEAISHAKAAGVPIVVAINKIDKESANVDRVKQELMEYALVPEEWGGDTIMVPVSAITGENLDTLLEMLLLVAEVEDLNANPDRLARGTVIEANLDKARGPVATLLIQNGTLRIGDSVVAGPVFGKVRAMIDDLGKRVSSAAPSFAVEVLGLNDVPAAGDEFEVYAEEKMARSVADSRASEQRQSRLQQAMASRRVTLNTLSVQAQEGDLKELNLLLKGDVQGSVEAILAALQQLPQNEVQIRVLLAAPGEISETDVDLAAASGAVIVGFNTTLATGARQSADRLGVDVRDYDIIYNLLDDIQGAMEGLLEPELVEEPLGQVEVRAVFPVRKGTVAGSYVLSGKVTRNCNLRVTRGGNMIYEGKLDSLKRMKEDVKDVAQGFECGIGIDNFNGWQEGDIIDAYRLVTKRRTLAMA